MSLYDIVTVIDQILVYFTRQGTRGLTPAATQPGTRPLPPFRFSFIFIFRLRGGRERAGTAGGAPRPPCPPARAAGFFSSVCTPPSAWRGASTSAQWALRERCAGGDEPRREVEDEHAGEEVYSEVR